MSIKGLCLLATAMAILLAAGGCGDSDSDSGGSADADAGKVTVETGSLSKAEFTERSDQLCKEARTQFQGEYENFVKANSQGGLKVQGELVNTILVPSFEQLVDQIGSVGAPSGDEEEIAAFLNALQRRLDKLREQPSEAFKTLSPLAGPIKLARAYGLTGCADSLG